MRLVFSLAVLCITIASVRGADPPQLQADLQRWWQKYRTDVDSRILSISDREITVAYADARRVAALFQLGKDFPKTFVRPSVLRQWLRQFLWYDLEPALATILELVPAEHRQLLHQRLVSKQAPAFLVYSNLLAAGGWEAERSTLHIMPERLQTYGRLRHELLHEWIHCLIEDQQILMDDQTLLTHVYLCEGMTEYLTLKIEAARGWKSNWDHSGYELEVAIVTLLLPMAGSDMWRFYLVGPEADSSRPSVHELITQSLVKQGVDQALAVQFVSRCKLLRITEREEDVHLAVDFIRLNLEKSH